MDNNDDVTWEHPGEVSLWVGQFKSEEQLEKYLEFDYTDDEVVKPEFCTEFQIVHFDEDFREAYIVDTPSGDLSVLLDGCSYDDVLIPLYLELNKNKLPSDTNAVILLYNYKYHGKIKESRKNDCYIKYIGNIRYD